MAAEVRLLPLRGGRVRGVGCLVAGPRGRARSDSISSPPSSEDAHVSDRRVQKQIRNAARVSAAASVYQAKVAHDQGKVARDQARLAYGEHINQVVAAARQQEVQQQLQGRIEPQLPPPGWYTEAGGDARTLTWWDGARWYPDSRRWKLPGE